MIVHKVTFDVDRRGRFTYSDPVIVVYPGDKIVWKCKKNYPYAIFIKSPITPLDKEHYVSRPGRTITAKVLPGASIGYYPYGAGVYDGTRIRLGDPEIIVRRP